MKKGFTTGTCAQAAAKAAAIMLTTRKLLKKVRVQTPSGIALNLNLIGQKIKKSSASCAVMKDSGDDPDITNGMKIYAEVRLSAQKGVIILGGRGVGRVTKPGLAVGVGEYAINPVPRQMIIKELIPLLPKDKGLDVTISVPNGEELAKKTYNPRLGIVGGISIIGTSGIVEPKSLDAYKASLSLQLNVLKAQGYRRAVLVLGYVGQKYCQKTLKLKEDSVIKIGDHVGFMLGECARKKIGEVLLIGHIGKMIKIANGQFNTHCQFGDNRIESIARYAQAQQADKDIIKGILKQSTAEATIEILRKAKLIQVFSRIAQDVAKRAGEFVNKNCEIDCIILSLRGEVLGESIYHRYRPR